MTSEASSLIGSYRLKLNDRMMAAASERRSEHNCEGILLEYSMKSLSLRSESVPAISDTSARSSFSVILPTILSMESNVSDPPAVTISSAASSLER